MNTIKDINKKKNNTMILRLDNETKSMINTLKASPYFINISEYLRASIKHLFTQRTNKQGRPK